VQEKSISIYIYTYLYSALGYTGIEFAVRQKGIVYTLPNKGKQFVHQLFSSCAFSQATW
jgi:hypothetical protein